MKFHFHIWLGISWATSVAAAQPASSPLPPAPPPAPPAMAPPPASGASWQGSAAASTDSPSPPAASAPRLRAALHTEAAFGIEDGPFYNHLVGPRLDYLFSETVSAGVYLGYVNLKAKDGGRAHNTLPYVELGYRPALNEDLFVLFRVASGYLPKNGPFMRLSSGLGVRIGERMELGVDLLAPAFWSVRDRTAVSLDLGLEVAYSF